ncbi:hypothetical protein [Streptomyces sp. NPDC090022]
MEGGRADDQVRVRAEAGGVLDAPPGDGTGPARRASPRSTSTSRPAAA